MISILFFLPLLHLLFPGRGRKIVRSFNLRTLKIERLHTPTVTRKKQRDRRRKKNKAILLSVTLYPISPVHLINNELQQEKRFLPLFFLFTPRSCLARFVHCLFPSSPGVGIRVKRERDSQRKRETDREREREKGEFQVNPQKV